MTELQLCVRNVGGIEELETSFDEGVTLVSGPNASNKTSLLHALSFAFGREDVPVRSGTSEAEVTLSVDGKSVTRTAKRVGTGISITGEPWIDSDDSDALSSFAALLEFNPFRTAVRNGQSFEETLKAPLDLETLEAERSAKVTEKRRIQQQLEDLEGVESELAVVRQDIEQKRDRVSELESELESLRDEQTDQTGSDEQLERLREKRADLVAERDDQRQRVENTEDAIDRLDERRESVERQISDAEAELDEYEVDELRSEKERLERQIAEREERLGVLQSVLTANREMVDGEFTGVLGQESSLMGDTYTCWACGQQADEEAFADTIDDLVELIEQDRNRIDEHQPRIEEVESELEAARRAESRVRELRTEKREIEQSLSSRRESLETQRERLQEIEAELEDVATEIDEYQEELVDTETDLTAEIEDTRVQLQTTRSEVERLESRREELQAKIEERAELEQRLEEIRDEIRTLTDRIENAERELRESFNETMDDLVDLLGFESIQRVWLDGDFELVVARDVDGNVQHESVEHLAESERELIGLVLGLAGYLNYDISEYVPVLALDSLGAFDMERARRLIEYFAEVTDFVVVAEHPERADQLDFATREVASLPQTSD